VYYNQPLLSRFSIYFHAPVSSVGLIATAAQGGYALGMLLFVPLGDIVDRRRVILLLSYVCAVLLIFTALSQSLAMLIVLQFLVGITAVSAQLLIPLAVELADASERGRTVGYLMAGLLGGLLCARTVSGALADWLGWRATFWLAAGLMLATAAVLQFVLPHRAPAQRLSYAKLMQSLLRLSIEQPRLRSIAAISALSFGGFCAFWAVLSFFLNDRYHVGSVQAGLFGLVGLAGALSAPVAGRLSDRLGPAFTLNIALIVSALSFLVMWGYSSMIGLLLGVLLLDLGVQSTQVAAQSEVMGMTPEYRSRLNTLYMVSRFLGGALGSCASAVIYGHYGWAGACGLGAGALLLSLGIQLLSASRPSRRLA